jgi:hypothetical protein
MAMEESHHSQTSAALVLAHIVAVKNPESEIVEENLKQVEEKDGR